MENNFNLDQRPEGVVRDLKTDLNSYAFSQKFSRLSNKIEARQLSKDERRSLLNLTFALGNKAVFASDAECPKINLSKNYNLRYIEIDYCKLKNDKKKNIFSKKAA